LGIGTSSPSYPLEVNGTIPNTSGTGAYFFAGASYFTSNNVFTTSVTLKTSNAIWSGAGFYTPSDIRIKKNIRKFDALDLLHKLNPVLFTYIENNISEYGFIAQDIDSNLLQLTITKSSSFIPNIFEKTDVSKNIITLLDKSTSIFEKDNSGNVIPQLKLYDSSNNEILTNIVSIKDDKSFEIDTQLNMDKVFVYGQKVSDFNIVKKDEIITITTAAVQSIDKIVQEQQKTIEGLQIENNEVKTKLANISERLTALENK
jgi:hypothetical protein